MVAESTALLGACSAGPAMPCCAAQPCYTLASAHAARLAALQAKAHVKHQGPSAVAHLDAAWLPRTLLRWAPARRGPLLPRHAARLCYIHTSLPSCIAPAPLPDHARPPACQACAAHLPPQATAPRSRQQTAQQQTASRAPRTWLQALRTRTRAAAARRRALMMASHLAMMMTTPLERATGGRSRRCSTACWAR